MLRTWMTLVVVDVVVSMVEAMAWWCPSSVPPYGSLLDVRFSNSFSWFGASPFVPSKI